jgi:hypothetical protein
VRGRHRNQGRGYVNLGEIANAIELGHAVSEALEAEGQVNALTMQLDTLINDRIGEASRVGRGDRVDHFLAEKLRIKRRILHETVTITRRILQHELTTLEAV